MRADDKYEDEQCQSCQSIATSRVFMLNVAPSDPSEQERRLLSWCYVFGIWCLSCGTMSTYMAMMHCVASISRKSAMA